MISSKIKELRKVNKITEKELSDYIGMTVTGFRQAVVNETLKVNSLKLIAEKLKVPVSYFFEDAEPSIKEPGAIYQTANGNNNQMSVGLNECRHRNELLKKEIEGLKKEMQLKDRIIGMLENTKK
jgi:transcriptional regulator with XRE-family HTH domain